MKKWKPLILSLVISLGTGGLSALLTRRSSEIYETLIQPPLAPKSILIHLPSAERPRTL